MDITAFSDFIGFGKTLRAQSLRAAQSAERNCPRKPFKSIRKTVLKNVKKDPKIDPKRV